MAYRNLKLTEATLQVLALVRPRNELVETTMLGFFVKQVCILSIVFQESENFLQYRTDQALEGLWAYFFDKLNPLNACGLVGV